MLTDKQREAAATHSAVVAREMVDCDGLLVTAVRAGSVAERHSVEVGDTITHVNGRNVTRMVAATAVACLLKPDRAMMELRMVKRMG
jgi:C-terminal processing protease CtpA/Prc